MNFKRKLSIISIPFISVLPMAVIVSCSSSSDDSANSEKAKKALNDFFKSNTDALVAKDSSKPIIKNFVEEKNWNNIDQLIEVLNKYFNVSDSFKNELTKDNNFIYQRIKKIVIQPTPGTASLTVIFYLNNQTSDKYLVSKEIENALDATFAYENEIAFPKDHQIEYFESKEAFDQVWNKANGNPNDINAIKEILRRAFGFSDSDQEKLAQNIKDKKLTMNKNSSYQVSLYLKQDVIDQGFIFSKTSIDSSSNTSKIYFLNEISYPLVK